jgi:membrane-associated phospholipid phosphatase
MKALSAPFLLAAIVTVLVGVAVWMEPYFAGDVAVARAIQAALPGPGWWATPVSRLAPAPARYYVMAIALVLSFVVARWRGLLIAAGFVLLEHYFAESTKAIFSRPRPSPELIAVAGNPSGFSFPSTTITFFAVTFGTLAVLTWHSPKAPFRWLIFGLASGMLLVGGIARVALGAHWPSDVVLTTVMCLSWVWATSRVVIGRR